MRLAIILGALLTLVLADAASAATCRLSTKEQRGLGPTYVTSLSTSRVSCTAAKRLVRAYHRCRFRNGGKDGRCSSTSGYRCSERRSGIKTQFNGNVTCRDGSRTIKHRYTQFT